MGTSGSVVGLSQVIPIAIGLFSIGLTYLLVEQRQSRGAAGILGLLHAILAYISTGIGTYSMSLTLSPDRPTAAEIGIWFSASAFATILSTVFFIIALIIALNAPRPPDTFS